MRFIMISENDTNLDFNDIKANNIDSIYIRASVGEMKDSKFEEYYTKAKEVGLEVSAYHLYKAPINPPYTVDSAREGRCFGKAISGKRLDFPVLLLMDNYKKALHINEIYNGINAFAYHLDENSEKYPVRNTNGLCVAGTSKQLTKLKKDSDLKIYPKICVNQPSYPRSKYFIADKYNNLLVFEKL